MLALALLLCAAQTPAAVEPPKPEELLFARVHVLGDDLTEGVGLAEQIGAPTTLADVVDGTLLFPRPPIRWHAFPTASVAPQQVRAAQDADASLVIALDYLVPFVYAEADSDEARVNGVGNALKLLEPLKGTIVLGDLPDFHATLGSKKPAFTEKQLPSVAALATINASVRAWAEPRKNVVVAPLAEMYAHVLAGEAFTIRGSTIPATWTSELMQADRVHTYTFGSIAAWLTGLNSLCNARRDLDASRFDWSVLSVYRRVYASKEAERKAAEEKAIAARRLAPTRPPPARPLPPDPEVQRREEEAKRRGIDVRDLERNGRDTRTDKEKKRDQNRDDGGDGGGG